MRLFKENAVILPHWAGFPCWCLRASMCGCWIGGQGYNSVTEYALPGHTIGVLASCDAEPWEGRQEDSMGLSTQVPNSSSGLRLWVAGREVWRSRPFSGPQLCYLYSDRVELVSDSLTLVYITRTGGGFGKNQLARTHFLRFWLSRWGPRICILTSPSGGPDAGGPHLEKPISHVPSSSDNTRFYQPACECSRAMLPLHLPFPPGCTANLHFPAPLSQGLVLARATWTRMTCATFRPSLWNISHDLPLSLYPFSLATWTQMTQQRTPKRTGDSKDIR